MLSRIHLLFIVFLIFGFLKPSSDCILAQPVSPRKISKESQWTALDLNRITVVRGYSFRNQSSPFYSYAYIDSNIFMDDHGFFISGINDKGEKWASGVYTPLNMEDYISGKPLKDDPNELYHLSSDSEPFGIEWQLWKNAVELGAEFYDGNNDGIYDPADLNNNGRWDSNEDRPALIGDELIWTTYYDGLPENRRKIRDQKPQGIQITETLWGYNSVKGLETAFFIKYSIENDGSVSPENDSVYFSLLVDADLGYSWNDYIASDSSKNSAYFYYLYSDPYVRGDKQLSLSANMLQGPIIKSADYITAYFLSGDNLEVKELTGHRNLNICSVGLLSNDNIYSSADKIRERMIYGDGTDPCSSFRGEVFGYECSSINKRFIFSGDPLNKTGWINTLPEENVLLLTVGPFKLNSEEKSEIIFAFSVGEGKTGLDAHRNSKIVQNHSLRYFFGEPEPMPAVEPIIITDESSIELIWETSDFFNYRSEGYYYDMDFEGFNVFMYNSPSTNKVIDGKANSVRLAAYDIRNEIRKILISDPVENDNDLLYDRGEQLDPVIYSDPDQGRILLKISRDPFSNTSLKKGRPYYFSVNPFAINKNELIRFDENGTYLLDENASFGYFESPPVIITDNKGNPGIVIDENKNDPYFRGIPLQHVNGNSEVEITYTVYDKNAVTDDVYEVGFIRNYEQLYGLNYYVKNVTKNIFVFENLPAKEEYFNVQNLIDGFTIEFKWLPPGIQDVLFTGDDQWFKDFNDLQTGVFYLGVDDLVREKITPILPLKQSTAISADKLADVELRFGEESKAYRYLRKTIRYLWAGEDAVDSGYTPIPVAAYRINIDSTTTRLSLGYLENGFLSDSLIYPDGKWNPATSIQQSKEYLVIFNSPYSEDPFEHSAYTGTQGNPANITHGYKLESENDSLKDVAKSPWFDAMYVVGFETEEYYEDFRPEGKLFIDANHVLSPRDKYLLRIKKEKTISDEKDQFEKISVYPNPLFAYNPSAGYFGNRQDEPFVTFTNVPQTATLKIFTLSGVLVRTIEKNSLSSNVRWDLMNEHQRRVGSGMYLAVIESRGIGKKVLKFSIIMPQKSVHF